MGGKKKKKAPPTRDYLRTVGKPAKGVQKGIGIPAERIKNKKTHKWVGQGITIAKKLKGGNLEKYNYKK